MPRSCLFTSSVIILITCILHSRVVDGFRTKRKTPTLASSYPPCPDHATLRGSQCHCELGYHASVSNAGSNDRATSIGFNATTALWKGQCQPDKCSKPYKYLLFEGGGVKGIAYGSVVRALEDAGIMDGIEGLSGASAGSQAATALAAGYTGEELIKILGETNFKSLLGSGSLPDTWSHFGYYSGESIDTTINEWLTKKTGHAQTTFKQLYEFSCTGVCGGYKSLRIPAFCVNTGKLVWFDYMATPDVRVSQAVRASSSIPFFFRPTSITMPSGKTQLFADAGMTRNLPHDDFQIRPDAGALGFLLIAVTGIVEKTELKDVKAYALQLFKGLAFGEDSSNALQHSQKKAALDLVQIDPMGTESTDFQLGASDKLKLLMNGYEAIPRQLVACDISSGKTVSMASNSLPSWLQEIQLKTYKEEFVKKLRIGASAFSDWWLETGRPFFQVGFQGEVWELSDGSNFYNTVMLATGKKVMDYHLRQVEVFVLHPGMVFLLTHADSSADSAIKEVYLIRGNARRERGYKLLPGNKSTTSPSGVCTRIPLLKAFGSESIEKILVSNSSDYAPNTNLKFCGEPVFAQHVCSRRTKL